jgi:hypothetical protein
VAETAETAAAVTAVTEATASTRPSLLGECGVRPLDLSGMADARGRRMNELTGVLVRHRDVLRLAWLALIVVLAACQQRDGGGDGIY